MAEPLSVTIEEAEAGNRLDSVLSQRLDGLSRTRIKALILAGAVSSGGATICEPRYAVKRGETITVDVPEPEPPAPRGEAIPLAVLYEDDAVIVIDKPAGMVVHPGAGNPDGTLVNALIAHCGDSLSGIGGVKRPGIVHRIDKDTSGVLVVAKTDAAHQALAAQFADHGRTGDLDRVYLALVWGAPTQTTGTIDAPLGRSPTNPQKFAVRRDGKTAVTHFRVLERFAGDDGAAIASLIECRLETGRTHQIRVHMAHIGHPLIGDPLYATGFKTKIARLPEEIRPVVAGFERQALHAASLQFTHPGTGEILEFEAELPDDMTAVLAAFGS
ncbi:MAG: RluA family pseudouridine synthase [Rhodobiaceae bacterium]|nr:RluA family pseudouridine synthase [Rhodobiaceae bacterium]